MFMMIIFVLQAILLFLAGGALLYMGVFRAHREGATLFRKVFSGIFSYGLSAVVWFFLYSYHYLGW